MNPENTQPTQPLSTPEADAAALQAIEALESESNEVFQSTTAVTPVVEPSPEVTAAPLATPEATVPAQPTPVSQPVIPFGETKKPSNKIVIILGAVIVLAIIVGVVSFFVL